MDTGPSQDLKANATMNDRLITGVYRHNVLRARWNPNTQKSGKAKRSSDDIQFQRFVVRHNQLERKAIRRRHDVAECPLRWSGPVLSLVDRATVDRR